jgi:hypothetical protein
MRGGDNHPGVGTKRGRKQAPLMTRPNGQSCGETVDSVQRCCYRLVEIELL